MKIIRTLREVSHVRCRGYNINYIVHSAHRTEYTYSRNHALSNASRQREGWQGKKISALQRRMEILGVMELNGARHINIVNNNTIVHVVQMS